MKKILCLSPLCHGIRRDSGKIPNIVDPSYLFSTMTESQKKNIVVKLTNTNFMPHENAKFTELKKDREKFIKEMFLRELKKFDLEDKI